MQEDNRNPKLTRRELLRRASVAAVVAGPLASVLAACGQSAGSTPTAAVGGASPSPSPSQAAASPSPSPTQAAASASPSPSPSKPAASPTPAEITTGSGSVQIDWWHITTSGEGKDNWTKQAQLFTKQHPNVSIKITILENQAFKNKLATVMQSGSPPDVFQGWGGGVLGEYARAGLVKDITADLQQNGWGDSFLQGPLDLYKIDGKYYGVPWQAGMVGFWYNKELFDKAGIKQLPTTWDELLDVVKQLKAAGITPIALGEKDSWTGAFWWEYLALRVGGKEAFEKAYNRQGSFADEPFVEAGRLLKQLVDLKPFQTGFLGASYSDHQALMANEKAAMELMGQWALIVDSGLAKKPEEFEKKLDWFPFPEVKGGAGKPTDALGGADGFAIGKDAPPETIDFVRFLTRPELQKQMGATGLASLPTVKAAASSVKQPALRKIQQALSKATYYQLYYDQFLPPATGAAVNDNTQRLFAGTASPEDVAKAIEQVAATELG